jgi:hypothetical protein
VIDPAPTPPRPDRGIARSLLDAVHICTQPSLTAGLFVGGSLEAWAFQKLSADRRPGVELSAKRSPGIHPFWGIAERELFSATLDFDRRGRLFNEEQSHYPRTAKLDKRRNMDAEKHGDQTLASRDRFRTGPGISFRPRESLRIVHLFANEAAQATDRSGPSGLDKPIAQPACHSSSKRSRNVGLPR